MKDLKRRVLDTVRKYQMISPGNKVLIAVSGGADSVALLHLLWELREELRIKLAIAHYHHQLRGKDADLDESFCRGLAEKFQLDFFVGRAEPEWWKHLRGSLEELARSMRYDFLERTGREIGADKIALGHNADDQAEGILINLLRGSGLLGLAGMPAVRGQFIRPLLEIKRQEVLNYCWEHNLGFRVDKSNQDRQFLRNRIRAELLPLLQSYNPEIVNILSRTSEILQAEEKFLEEESEIAFTRLAQKKMNKISFPLREFLKVSPALRRRLLRLAIKGLKKDLRKISAEHIFELEKLIVSGKAGFELDLPDRIKISKSYEELTLELSGGKKSPFGFEPVELIVPGYWQIQLNEEYRLNLKVEPADYIWFQKRLDKTQKRASIFEKRTEEVFLNLEHISGPLCLRCAKAGDRLQPLGMKGHKKLKDIFQELRVPRNLRLLYPLIADSQELVWVPGFQLSEKARIYPDCQKIFLFKIGLSSKAEPKEEVNF